METRDRLASLLLIAAATAAWGGVGALFVTRSPVGDPQALLAGAVLLGSAIGLTAAPLLWLAGFARRRVAQRGDWWRATRRGALIGLVVFLLVLVRAQGALSVPLGLFVVGMGVLVELSLSLRR